VRTASGLFVGDADFGGPRLRTVGEFDGRIKYGLLQDAAEAVYKEKLREDDLRAEDLGVVRWGWDVLADFDETATRLRRSFRPS